MPGFAAGGLFVGRIGVETRLEAAVHGTDQRFVDRMRVGFDGVGERGSAVKCAPCLGGGGACGAELRVARPQDRGNLEPRVRTEPRPGDVGDLLVPSVEPGLSRPWQEAGRQENKKKGHHQVACHRTHYTWTGSHPGPGMPRITAQSTLA